MVVIVCFCLSYIAVSSVRFNERRKQMKKLITLTLALTTFAACGPDVETHTDRDDAPIQVSVDGRGDSNGVSVSTDEIELILHIANTYRFDELDAFLDVRAAKNIVAARADETFTSLDQLDDVAYVGARAFEAFLNEARTFSDDGAYDVRDYFEATRNSALTQLHFRGELGAQLADQPFVGNGLSCGADGECTFNYAFEKIRDYSDTAGPGNVVMSFRTEDAANSNQNRALTSIARRVIESRFDGPMACTELPQGHCVPLYGCGTTQYRCNVRIPE